MKKAEKLFLKLLGSQILKRREAAGLSREAFAKKVGLKSRIQVYRLENGLHSPKIFVLINIAKELGCSLSELVDVR